MLQRLNHRAATTHDLPSISGAHCSSGGHACRAAPARLFRWHRRCGRAGIELHAAALGGAVPGDSAGSRAPPLPMGSVVLPTALALLVCNMDRICMSVAIVPIAQEFGWPPALQGVIQSAFLWGYMATQLLGGFLADRYGGRAVMAGGIAWFSAASALLPLAASPAVAAAGLTLPAVLAARCAVGLGEGVALPAMNNLVAAHVAPSAKSRALGMCFTGFHSGNLLGLLLSPAIALAFGWRTLFYSFGLVGIPLLAYWLSVAPSGRGRRPPYQPPAESGSPRPDEAGRRGGGDAAGSTDAGGAGKQVGRGGDDAASAAADGAAAASSSGGGEAAPVTVLTLLSHPATWAIIIVNFINHWGYFIYLNWMPSYFKALGFDLRASSLLSFLPWALMAVGSSAAGFLADALIARGVPVTAVRKRLQAVAFLVPALALQVLSDPNVAPPAAVAAMSIALAATSLGQAGFVANMSDIAPHQAGQMFGLCNTFGSAAGILGVVAVGLVVQATGSFVPVFRLTAAMYVAGAAVWVLLCTGERVF